MEQQLIELIEKLNSLAPEVWNYYLQRIIIEKTVGLITFSLLFVVSLIVQIKTWSDINADKDWVSRNTDSAAIVVTVSGFLLLLSALLIPMFVVDLSTPEFTAIQRLLGR